MRWILTLLVAFALTLGGAHNAGAARDPEAIEALRSRIGDILVRQGVPGVGIALIEGGRPVWTGGVGLADTASRRSIDEETHFRVGSITKTVIALTILRLAQRKVLQLDDEVADLAPELPIENRWHRQTPITIAHLLEHTAGFDDMRFNETSGPPQIEDLPLSDVLRRNPRSRVARWRPGSRHAYSNPGYTVAAYVIESVTGEPYEQVVRREVLEPLGMGSAAFRRTPQIRSHLAQGYRTDGSAIPYWVTYHRPAGHLIATPRELASLVQMFLRRGQGPHGEFLPASVIEQMQRPRTRTGPLADTAYGLGLYGDIGFRYPMYGHDGGLPGFVSSFRYIPELDAGYVIVFNAIDPLAMREVRAEVLRFLDARNRPSAAPPSRPARIRRGVDVEPWLGQYEFASPRHELLGFAERLLLSARLERDRRGELVLSLDGLGFQLPLRAVGDGRFTTTGHSGALVALRHTDDGAPALALGDLHFERTSRAFVAARRAGLRLATYVLILNVLVGVWWIPGWIRRGRTGHVGRLLGPGLLASVTFLALPFAFVLGAVHETLGRIHPHSVAVFVLSWVFPWLGAITLARAIRELRAPWPWWTRAWALAVGVAGFGLALYLMWQQIVGLRTWAW